MNKLAGNQRRFRLFGERKKNLELGVQDEYQLLTVRQLMIRKFLRNRMALLSFIALVIIYLVTLFAGFFAPYTSRDADSKLTYSPPMAIRLQDPETGHFHLPFFYPLRGKRNMETFRLEYVEERERRVPIQFFVKGEPYKALGVIAWDVHLFGSSDPEERLHIMGSDVRGRDLFSRIIYSGQVSLSVGIFGVLITIAVGSVIGTLSGYYGGVFDNVVQRIIETIRSFPQLPLWMALAAAIPPQWPPEWVYAGIVVVLAFINWTGLSREVRGLVLSLKERDYVHAAEASGASTARIVRKHLIPNMASHIIVTATLAVPVTILGESALSFLGIGVRPPMVSWGLLLNDAIKIQTLCCIPGRCFRAPLFWLRSSLTTSWATGCATWWIHSRASATSALTG
ncbi:MAG: ABC transporter permease [Chloroflexi bacterium]|nr:ABC transporter permease [Chloroflexota bacterium]